MNKKIWALITVFILLFNLIVFGAEKAPESAVKLAKELAEYGKNPVIVKAVKAQNAKGVSLADIKKMDEKWINTPGVADYMKALITNDCGKYLQGLMDSKDYFAEIFVMDNQGANVAMTNKTSDYWQGDEDKFIKTFNGGKGNVFISDVEFDDSTQAYLVQISVPVYDGNKVIGAITFGVDVDKI